MSAYLVVSGRLQVSRDAVCLRSIAAAVLYSLHASAVGL